MPDEKKQKKTAGAILSSRRVGLLSIIILLTFLFGYWSRGPGKEIQPTEDFGLEQAGAHERQVYVCPMMCVPPMAEPGRCPVCGMNLISVSAGDETDKAGPAKLRLSRASVKLAEIQVAPVKRKFAEAEVRLFGQIDYDPAHTSEITAFMPGVIDRVYVKRAGKFVRWGEPLFDLYSSDLLETQKQLIEAVKFAPSFLAFQGSTPHIARDARIHPSKAVKDPETRSKDEEAALKTIAAIRQKLSILGLPKRDIDEFMKVGEATGIATVYASMYGQVIEQKAFEGSFVNTGTPIFVLADPKFVWLKLDAYEMDYPWIRKGQEVTFQTDAYPGESFRAKVVYIDPVFNTKTRTFGIGALCAEDHGGRLKAGLLVRAVIRAQLGADGNILSQEGSKDKAPLVIPASAPLITGKRAVVYVASTEEEGVFEGREVTLGPRAKDCYVVVDGLKEGESVVVNGNFKIDSAVQILAKSSMMDLKGGTVATEHNLPGGSVYMDEDYSTERMRSRLQSSLESGENLNETFSQPELRRGRQLDMRSRAPSAITRRKPGMYGDNTRPSPAAQDR